MGRAQRVRRRGWLATVVVAVIATGCGTGEAADRAAEAAAPTSTTVGAAPSTHPPDPPTTTEESTLAEVADPPTGPPPDAGLVEVPGLRGGRYCEVLLVRPGADAITAEVYNSQGFGDCPAERWEQLDPNAIAAERGVPIALLNGPRYWLMDRITRRPPDEPPPVIDVGGITMFRAATVEIAPDAMSATPYVASSVDRATVFTYDAGSRVYELRAADGERYVMQSWSQQVDPALDEDALAGLGDRLALPEGWSFATRVLDAPLRIDTTDTDARVLQDELGNSYSLVPPG